MRVAEHDQLGHGAGLVKSQLLSSSRPAPETENACLATPTESDASKPTLATPPVQVPETSDPLTDPTEGAPVSVTLTRAP